MMMEKVRETSRTRPRETVMANYSTTIIKLFVRSDLVETVPTIVEGLRTDGWDGVASGVDEHRQSEWIDFRRLLPVPAELDVTDEYQNDAEMVVDGRWPPRQDRPNDMVDTPEGRVSAYRSLSSGHSAAVDRVTANIAKWGVPNSHEWRVGKWGTKWLSDSSEPRIESTSEHDGYEEFEDCTMIHYRISTAWSEPAGYLRALNSLCMRFGMGMRCWVSHEDGGTTWDPEAEEYRTVWTPLDDYDLDIEQMTASDMLALMGGDMEITPDEQAYARMGRDPLEMAMRSIM